MSSFTTWVHVSALRRSACLIAMSIACLASFSTISTQAQQNPNAAPGFRSDGVYDFSGIDDVSLFNGALTLNRVGNDWRLTRMADRFGNGLDVIYGTDGSGNTTWTLDGGHRLQVVTFTDPGAAFPNQRQLISRIQLAAFGNKTATYTFNYTTKAVDRPPAHNHPTLDRTLQVQLLHQIDLPSDTILFEGSDALLVGPQAYVMGSSDSPAYHYSLDHLGSPRLITDATGQVEAKHKYYPFGEEATLSSQNRHPMKFTGHERDFNEPGESDDLDSMHARQCDPRKGRFLSVDPVRGSPGSPQSWNGYAYVQSNPMMYTDPTGEISMREGASLVVSSIPIIGDWKDAQEVLTGVDLISGEKLSTAERVITVVAAVVPIVGGAVIRKAFKAAADVPRGTKLLPERAGPTANISPTEVAVRAPDTRFPWLTGGHGSAQRRGARHHSAGHYGDRAPRSRYCSIRSGPSQTS